MQLATLDMVIIGIYAVMIIGIAQWVSREKAGHKKDTNVQTVALGDIDFTTSKSFNMATVATILVVIALYATWW